MDGMGRDRVGIELRHGWVVDGIGVGQGWDKWDRVIRGRDLGWTMASQ